MRRFIPLLALALAASSCSSGGTVPETLPTGPPSTVSADATTTTIDPRPCAATTVLAPQGTAGTPTIERLPADSPHVAAVAASQTMFDCAVDVVVVDATDVNRIALAAVLAVNLQAPLLVGDAETANQLTYELDRLAPQRLWLVGESAEASAPEWTTVERIGGTDQEIAAEIATMIEADEDLLLPAGGGTDTVAIAIEAMVTGRSLTPPATDGSVVPVSPVSGNDITAGSGESGMVWLIDLDEPEAALVAAVGAITSGGFMGLVDGTDLRNEVALSRDLAPFADGVRMIQIVGGTEDAGWQAMVLLRGDQLPGGGFLLFPGRRIIALYGNPLTTSLGVLGEQDPAGGLARLEAMSVGYDADGTQVIPGWELIATVAAANPGNDGDYSNEMGLDVLTPWVDFAAANGMYVLLDLQPGRETFLSQAMLYEELLRQPHVGLALDPEWRLGPDETHGGYWGAVEPAEVNAVVEWLAELTRNNALPQKMLLLHQFWFDMIPNRELIEATPEVSLVIQMDGHGEIADKMGTWQSTITGWDSDLTTDWSTDQFEYGWKHFLDEDIPGPISAAEVLQLVPIPVFISIQ
ncbi:MAG: hypothetical protein HZA58_00480 [Acidimicrobiia bacterium]|nr:hypothetical protein [Acidimicrobiia bacterium]